MMSRSDILASDKTYRQSHRRAEQRASSSWDQMSEIKPAAVTPYLPAVPPPVLHKYTYPTPDRLPNLSPRDSVHTLLPDQTLLAEKAARPYQASSKSSSSASNSFAMTPISSNDMEKDSVAASKDHDRKHRHKNHSSHRDPEKGGRHSARPGHRDTRRTADAAFVTVPRRMPYAYAEDFEDEEQQRVQEAHAVRILLFLALPCVGLSALNALWTLVALLVTALMQPARLCARRPTFGQQLGGLVGPALNLHLRCIYAPLAPHTDDDNDNSAFRPLMLVAVQMLSPLLSFGVMLAAWVVAVFWLTSVMIGDPAGLDRRDDGRETVLGLRRWWERWLTRSINYA